MNTPDTDPDILHEQARLLRTMTTSLEAGDPIAYHRAQERFAHLTWLREMKAGRRGETLENHTTPRYTWRTVGDNRVRNRHAENDGKVFAWDNPPPTGHPGDDHNCRCWAEPVPDEIKPEYARLVLKGHPSDNPNKWWGPEFIKHFYTGNGQSVRLSEIGHFFSFLIFYLYKISRGRHNTSERIARQIIEVARSRKSGATSYHFENSYSEFGTYHPFFGGGTASGDFSGTIEPDGAYIRINGNIIFNYGDSFTDVLNLREIWSGDSDPIGANWGERLISDFGGTYYEIYEHWTMDFSAYVLLDPAASKYE